MSYTLGSLTIKVFQAKPFQYAEIVTGTRLIGDGTNTTDNEVLQGGALPHRRASFGIRLNSQADVDTLDGYFANQDTLLFTDRQNRSRYVKLTACEVNELQWYWEASIELTALGAYFDAELSS